MNLCVVLKDDLYNQEILGLGWDFDYVMNISESDFPVRWREDQSWYLLMGLYRYVLMYDQSYIWTFSVKKVISQPWLVQKPSSLAQISFTPTTKWPQLHFQELSLSTQISKTSHFCSLKESHLKVDFQVWCRHEISLSVFSPIWSEQSLCNTVLHYVS